MPRDRKDAPPASGRGPGDIRPSEEDAALFRQTVGGDPNAAREPSDDERALFRQSMGGVRPLDGDGRVRPDRPRPRGDRRSSAPTDRHPIIATAPSGRMDGSSDIDRRTADRLRRGRYPIDMKVDLHGMTAAQAQSALFSAIDRGWREGKRCILLVTGKGGQARDPVPERDGWREPRTGVIRSSVPGWIDTPPHRDRVLALTPARQEHGGGGAFYLLLRRRRG